MELLNKIYADGMGPAYDYTPEGRLSRRTWARGIVTDYAYDAWGNLTNTVYSDDTPAVSLCYDAIGRQVEAHDAAGTTTFAYDGFGAITNETVVGVACTNTIERYWDGYGRSLGYALNGERQTTIGYDSITGRIATMLAAGTEVPFVWSYHPGSDLKSSLAYPNGLTASWQYDVNNQLLQVCNATPTNVISQYDYTYDAAGRRISCAHSGSAFAQDDVISYGYNYRGELTNAVAVVDAEYRYAYRYDCIGNRLWSLENTNRAEYAANCLNQYAAISNFIGAASIPEVFSPQYDADGNQTLIQTETGIWSVTYNGENRPVLWSNGITNMVMAYDRMGRRVVKNLQRFSYDGYLQIADNNGNAYAWDPTEPVATRPLVWSHVGKKSYYLHDGAKNVSDVVWRNSEHSEHYTYAPFGTFIDARNNDRNPWGFSSEFVDFDSALIYYNYRHYDANNGRWIIHDLIGEKEALNLYSFCGNGSKSYDYIGLSFRSLLRKQKCGVDSTIRQVAEYIEFGRLDLDTFGPRIIEVAGYAGGYPGQGDSAPIFLGVSREYVPWNSMKYQDKESVFELMKNKKVLGCRFKVRYVIDCECVCGEKVLHEWEESSEWGFIYGKLVWDDLAGCPSCDCTGEYNRFIAKKKNELANSCEL